MPPETPDSPPLTHGLRFGEFKVDLDTRRLTRSGRVVAIEPRVFDALVYLIEHRERLVEKEEFFDQVWEGEFVSDNALSRAIARLRRTLDDDANEPRFIETVHGRGYRFVKAVEPISAVDLEAQAAPSIARSATPHWRPLAAVAALVIAALTVSWIFALRDLPADGAAQEGGRELRLDPLRVAVLPLHNLSSEDESRYFTDGLTEQTLSVLSQIEGVRVISSTTSATFRDAGRRVSEIAAELGTGTLLEGSVRRDGDELRITVQLIDAASEELLWSRDFDTRLEDIFAVQSEIATSVADALQLSISSDRVVRIREGPTRKITAYDHYLKGRLAYRQGSRAGNETAVRHFHRALEIDPGFALAQAGLANAYAMRSMRFGFGDEERLAAEQEAEAALELDPRLPEAYKALGIAALNKGRPQLALAYNERALEINPSYDEALYNAASSSTQIGAWDKALRYQLQATNWTTGRAALASYLLVLGLDEEGRRLAATVLDEDPLSPYLNLNLAEIDAFIEGDLDAARRRIGRIIAAEPTWGRAHRMAGDVELWTGDLERARGHYAKAAGLNDPPDRETLFRIAWIDLALGRGEAADELFGRLRDAATTDLEAGSEDYQEYQLLGWIAAAHGKVEDSLSWRQAAIDAGYRLYWRDAADPSLDTLRGERRFEEQVEAMRREVAAMRERVRASVENELPRILQTAG